MTLHVRMRLAFLRRKTAQDMLEGILVPRHNAKKVRPVVL
jgi:hypothetical protein